MLLNLANGGVNFNNLGLKNLITDLTTVSVVSNEARNSLNKIFDARAAGGSYSLNSITDPNMQRQMQNFMANTKYATKDMATFEQYLAKTTGTGARFVSSLKSMAINLGAMLAVMVAIKAVQYVWDEINYTVAENKEKVEALSTSVKDLNSEYQELSKKGNDELTQAEKDRLDYLQRRIELENQLLDAEQRKLDKNTVGTSILDWFDKDSQKRKISDNDNDFVLNDQVDNFVNAKNSLDEVREQISHTQSLYDEEIAKGGLYNTIADQRKNELETLQQNEANYLKDIEKNYDDFVVKKGEYATNLEEINQVIDRGNLQGNDLEQAQNEKLYWEQRLKEVTYYIDSIEKLNGTYNFDIDALDEKFSKISKDELLKNFSAKDLELLATLNIDPNASLISIQAALKEAQTEAEENPIEVKVSATDAIAKIASVKKDYSSLKSALDEFKENKIVSSDTLSGLTESFGELEGFNDFLNTLGNSSSTYEQVKNSVSDLAAEYLSKAEILQDVNEDTKDLITSQLKSIGVTNAEAIVLKVLNKGLDDTAAQKILAANPNFLQMTDAEQQALLQEVGASEATTTAIYNLAFQKAANNKTSFAELTLQEAQALMLAAKSAGTYGLALEGAAHAQQVLLTKGDSLAPQSKALLEKMANQSIQDLMSEIQIDPVDIQISPLSLGGEKDSTKSSSSENYTNWFDAFLKDKENQLDKLVKKNDELNAAYERAVKNGDAELAQSLTDEMQSNQENLQTLYALSATELRSKMSDEILPIFFKIAPELKDQDISDFSEKTILAIQERLKEDSLGLDTFNSLLSTLQSMDTLVGSSSGQGEWAQSYAEAFNTIDTQAKTHTEFIMSLYDKEINKNDEVINSIDKRMEIYDDELSLIEKQQEFYGTSEERAVAYYNTSKAKLEAYAEKSIALTSELRANQNALADAQERLANINPSDSKFKDTYSYLKEQIKKYTVAIEDNESALRSNKSEQADYYHSVLSSIQSNLSEIYGLKKTREQEALTKRQEEETKVLEDQLKVLQDKNNELEKTNALLDKQLELQKNYRDKTKSYIDETTGKEIVTYDREKAKELQAEILDEQASQAYDKQVESLEDQQKELEDYQEKEQDLFDAYWEKKLSSFGLHLEAFNLAQEYGYEEALQGTSLYLNDMNEALYNENADMYKSGLQLTKSLSDGMFSNLDKYIENFVGKLNTGLNVGSAAVADRLSYIQAMQTNSQLYASSSSQEEKNNLAAINTNLGKSLGATFDSASGVWYSDSDKTQLLYDELKTANLKQVQTVYDNTSALENNVESLIGSTLTVGKNTISIGKNSTTISDGTKTISLATSDLIDNNDLFMSVIGESVGTIEDAMNNFSIDVNMNGVYGAANKSQNTSSVSSQYDNAVVKSMGSNQSSDGGDFTLNSDGSWSNANGFTVSGVGSSYMAQQVLDKLNGVTNTKSSTNSLETDEVTNSLNKVSSANKSNTSTIKSNTSAVASSTTQLTANTAKTVAAISSAITGISSLPTSIATAVSSSVKSSSVSSNSSGSSGNIVYRSGSSSSSSGSSIVSSVVSTISKAVSTLTGKKHDGIKSGFIGENNTIEKNEDLFKKAALGELKPNEVPIIALEDEAVVTKEQINNVGEALKLNYIPTNMFSGMTNFKVPNFNGITKNSQIIDNSKHYSLYGTTIKSDNTEQLFKEIEIKTKTI